MKETLEERVKALEAQMAAMVDVIGTLVGPEAEADQFAVAFRKFRERANEPSGVLRSI